jgi:O-antigen/teichoic acid export membrane protein
VYLHFLGVESYGLFALLNSYMTVAFLLDLGFSAAITREVARMSESSPERMRDLVWSVSLPYCAATLAVAITVYLAAPWIAPAILREGRDLNQPAIIAGVGFAGFALTLQLPVFLYTGGLAGLQRQDLANGIAVASTTLRHGGSVFLLWSFSSSVATVMIWQAIVATLTAIAAFTVLWLHLPSNHRWPRFQPSMLPDVWRFAAGVGSATLLGMLVFQSDKMFVGALLPLKEVGIYMVASVITANLMMLAQPVTAVAFPRLSQLHANGEIAAVRATFHKLGQLAAAMILPVAIVIAFFPQQTLTLWTHNLAVAADAAPILRLLAIGIVCNAFACVPYNMILAAGRTRPIFIATTVICVVVLPSLYILTRWWGITGTAIAMLGYQLMWLAACAGLLRPQLGWREWRQWIAVDALLPLTSILLVAAVADALAPVFAAKNVLLMVLAATWFAAIAVAVLTLPSLRGQALACLRQLRAWSFRPAS